MTFSIQDVRRERVGGVADATLALLGPGPVVVSVDVGVLDPEVLAEGGAREPGGLSPAELGRLCRELGRRAEVVGAAVLEMRPDPVRGGDDPAAGAGALAVAELLAGLAAQRRATATGRFRRTADQPPEPVRASSGARSSRA